MKLDPKTNINKLNKKKTIQYIEEMELKNLNNYLASTFSFKNSSTLKCNLCNNFIGTNLKSLAVHKRKCKGIKPKDDKSSDNSTDTDSFSEDSPKKSNKTRQSHKSKEIIV